MVYIIDKTNKPYRGTRSRAGDYEELKKSLKDSNPDVRKAAYQGINAIKKEDKLKTSMRDALIKAHRESDHNKIKDINDYVSTRKKYRNV